MKGFTIAAILASAALASAQTASPAATLSIDPNSKVITCDNADGSPFSGSVCQGPNAIVSCSAGVGTPLAISNTTAFPTPTGTTPTVSPTCYQKDGNNAYPAYDNTVYESSTTYTFIQSSSSSGSYLSSSSGSYPSSSSGYGYSSSSSMAPITSTVLSTQTFTITSCHPTVTNCPASKATYTTFSESVITITSVITLDTTYCPESESTSSPTTSPSPLPPVIPVVAQPPASPSPVQPETPSPSPKQPETPAPMSPEYSKSTPTPASSGCPGGCVVEVASSTVVYVIPTRYYVSSNSTTTSPSAGPGSPTHNFNPNAASANEAGVLAVAAGLVLAALF